MAKKLVACGHRVGKARMRRRMQFHRIQARGQRASFASTAIENNLPRTLNLLLRDFTAEASDFKRRRDIICIETAEGWLCLTAILDLHSRWVVDWLIQTNLQASRVADTLRMAWFGCGEDAPKQNAWWRLKVGRFDGRKLAARRDVMDELVGWLTFPN